MTLRVATALLLIAAAAGCGGPVELRGSLWEPPSPAPPLPLEDQHGRPFDLAAHRGDVVLVFFGFAHCPDVCPMTLSTWRRLDEALGADGDRVDYVFVTVDPERDTPERLAGHLAVFGEEIVGLTGSPERMRPVWEAWHVYRRRRALEGSAVGYLVDHTSRIFVVDPAGDIRMTHDFDASVEDLAHDVRALLRGA